MTRPNQASYSNITHSTQQIWIEYLWNLDIFTRTLLLGAILLSSDKRYKIKWVLGAVVQYTATTDLGLWARGEAHSVQTRRVAARTAPAEEVEMGNITLVYNSLSIHILL